MYNFNIIIINVVVVVSAAAIKVFIGCKIKINFIIKTVNRSGLAYV